MLGHKSYLNYNDKISLSLLISGILLLSFLAVSNKQPLIFDERLFPPNVLLLEEYGLSEEFLLKMNNQAPGPLYQFIHYPLREITQMKQPGIRVVNIILFLGIIIIMYFIFNIIFNNEKLSLIYALNLVAVPVVWQIAGLALTEIPSMLFASFSLFFIVIMYTKINRYNKVNWSVYLYAVLSGICIGFAIIGRATFLPVISLIFLLLHYVKDTSLSISLVILHLLPALLICLPVFFIWQGLTPPAQAFTGEGMINIWHGILAFAYAGIIFLLIAPKWYVVSKELIAIMLVFASLCFLVNLFFFKFRYTPMSESIYQFLPLQLRPLYSYLMPALFLTVAKYFFLSCLFRIVQEKCSFVLIFSVLAMGLVLGTSIKITHLFSSRYVAQVAPYMIIAFAHYDSLDKFKSFRIILAILIGFFSYNTYANYTIH